MPSTKSFKETCVKITAKIYFQKNKADVGNPVYFRLCIDLMHITPSVIAKGSDGSHQTRYAQWV